MQGFFSLPFIYQAIIALAIGLLMFFLQDRYYRKIKRTMVDEIEKRKVQAINLNNVWITTTSKTFSSNGWGMSCTYADVVFTENSILCFGYAKFFGLIPAYRGITQFCLGDKKFLPDLHQSIPIKTIRIAGDDLIIDYSGKFPSVTTTTMKDVVIADQFEGIKKMLHITSANYRDNDS